MSNNLFSYENLSFCIYIGNTSSITDEILKNYCSRFGTIHPSSSSLTNEKFCDFHLIEYSNSEQTQRFLCSNNHQINRIQLDVRSYKHLLIYQDYLDIDRKFYIGPIQRSRDEHAIVQFYKSIDSNLQYCSVKQDDEIYLLFQLSNRQLLATIFERQRIPIVHERHRLNIYKPTHPKQFRNRIVSMKNNDHQIRIDGLTRRITEKMLIGYFHKYAPVIACYIFPDDSKAAVIEFNDRKTVEKILETRDVYLEGANLTLSQSTRYLASYFSSSNTDHHNNIKLSPTDRTIPPLHVQYHSPFISSEPFLISTPPPCSTSASGWSSPPRSVVIENAPIVDRPTSRNSSTNGATTNSNPVESTDLDVKPPRETSPKSDLLNFAEQIQMELEQLRNEYRSKFEQDRVTIDEGIDYLIEEERRTLTSLNRYLIDRRHRPNSNPRQHATHHKRKYSPS